MVDGADSKKVWMSVTQVFNTLVEVPSHLSSEMKKDEALRLVGRTQGIKANVSTKTEEHKNGQ